MKLHLILISFVITCFVIVSHSSPINDERGASSFLEKFGYLEETDGTGAILAPDIISGAIKDFQRFVGLEETGELDSQTLAKMNSPRCGVKDKIKNSGYSRITKRYAHQGSKWPFTHLTYRISKYPNAVQDTARLDNEMARASKLWSDVSKLTFEERKQGQVTIDIRFERGEHGDATAFDGPGKTLAHAFFPQFGGNAHFDDDEEWTIDEGTGTNLLQVAAHEFGHSLGLSHSLERQALMAPYYYGYDPSFRLHEDDIEAIQSLYGTRDQSSPPTDGTPNTSGAPDLCQDAKIDAAVRTQDGNNYVFKGDFYWKYLSEEIAPGYPRRISDDWGGLEGNLDAALTLPNGKTYFFKGRRYWSFTNRARDTGYPKLISVGFKGIPNYLDAAVVWNGNEKPYFFKGNEYWRYDSETEPQVNGDYPLPITNWNGLYENIDAALQWENNITYFFKDDKYYRYNDINSEVDNLDPPYPRSTAVWWFGCKPVPGASNV